MAHDHEHFHSKEELNSYLAQQLFTIFICGAIGAVTLSMYAQDKLKLFLAAGFHKWVMLGGIGLLLLVVVRAIALWRFVGQLPPLHDHAQDHADEHAHHHDHAQDHACCGHDHDHQHAHAHDHQHAPASQAVTTAAGGGVSLNILASPAPPASLPLAGSTVQPHQHDHDHDHDHDHACCGHDHQHEHDQDHVHAPAVAEEDGHDHDHGWAPWRMVLLMLPVVLYFLNLPNQAMSADQTVNVKDLEFDKAAGGANGEMLYDVGFKELEEASLRPDKRDSYTGKTVRLVGQYVNIDEQRFTLVRLKMACCAPDAIPIKAVIVVDPSQLKDPKQARIDPELYRNKWVEVVGRVQFLNRRGTNEYYTALYVTPTAEKPLNQEVLIVSQPANPYLN